SPSGFDRLLPGGKVLIPMVLAERATVGDDQSRRPSGLRTAPELHDVVVNVWDRKRMLDGGMAVGDLGHVVHEQRAALGHHLKAELARGFDDHLALLAARLIIAFDRPCT